MNDMLLTRKEVPDYIRNTYGAAAAPTLNTLEKYASVGGGPRFVKVGARRVAYPVSEIDLWVKSRIGQPMEYAGQMQAA